MRTFSRWMPPSGLDSSQVSADDWLMGLILLAGISAALIVSEGTRYGFLAVLLLALFFYWRERYRRRQLARARVGEGLCTFARAFDRHAMEPRVIRATYEELTSWLMIGGKPVPLRPSDKLTDILRLDVGDLEDIAQDIAERAGRSLDETARNPLFGKVSTVADLVSFLSAQPPTAAV